MSKRHQFLHLHIIDIYGRFGKCKCNTWYLLLMRSCFQITQYRQTRPAHNIQIVISSWVRSCNVGVKIRNMCCIFDFWRPIMSVMLIEKGLHRTLWSPQINQRAMIANSNTQHLPVSSVIQSQAYCKMLWIKWWYFVILWVDPLTPTSVIIWKFVINKDKFNNVFPQVFQFPQVY